MKLQLEENLTFIPNKESGQQLTEGARQAYKCDICNKNFLQLEALQCHSKNHMVSCPECQKTFTEQGGLAKHQEEVHSQEKSFHCSQCDKSFKELRTLRLHLKIHNSEYPEHCEVCKKGFRTKWQLKQHLMDHGGKRPYPCPECTFTCKTKQQLNEHRRKHSGEKAYSCPLCATRFTYRNGLIKHTKLNRCPKKIINPDGEKIAKKKTKMLDQISRQKFDLLNDSEANSKAEKSVLDQKILNIIQKRNALKSQLGLQRVVVGDVNNNSGNTTNSLFNKTNILRDLLPSGQSFGAADVAQPSTTTFLTNSTDISSWAATLPAGTKVTVTHYDASKKAGQGEGLVATPTHTETIIVTPPKTDQTHLPSPSPSLNLPNDPMPLLHSRLSLPLVPNDPARNNQQDEANILANLGQASYPESFAVDPNDILLKEKPIKQEPRSPPTYAESNFDMTPRCSPLDGPIEDMCSPATPQTPSVLRSSPALLANLEAGLTNATPSIDVQLTAQALLMNVKPDPSFDPNLKIKKEFEHMGLDMMATFNQPGDLAPITNLNEIKREVLEELFDDKDHMDFKSKLLVPQLSVKSENEDELSNDDFYDISFKIEPISPQSNSSISESDHDTFSFHKDLEAIVENFGKTDDTTRLDDTTRSEIGSKVNLKPNNILPDLDLDFQNFFGENISDICMTDQDFFQMNIDSFDAAAELISNV